MSARDTILSKLKAAAPSSPLQDSLASYQSRAWRSASQSEKLDRFEQKLLASHAEVYRVTSFDQLIEQVLASAVDEQWANILCGDSSLMREAHAGFLAELRGKLIEHASACDWLEYQQSYQELRQQLFHQVQVGLSFCSAGIADSGSLVVHTSANEPRTLSLVPPIHLAVVYASQLTDNFAELVNKQAWHQGLPSNVLLISGPSKTADIQQTLAYGAHGPSRLLVYLLQQDQVEQD